MYTAIQIKLMKTGVMCHSLELICNCKSPFTYLQHDPGYHDFSSASPTTDGKIIEIGKVESCSMKIHPHQTFNFFL